MARVCTNRKTLKDEPSWKDQWDSQAEEITQHTFAPLYSRLCEYRNTFRFQYNLDILVEILSRNKSWDPEQFVVSDSSSLFRQLSSRRRLYNSPSREQHLCFSHHFVSNQKQDQEFSFELIVRIDQHVLCFRLVTSPIDPFLSRRSSRAVPKLRRSKIESWDSSKYDSNFQVVLLSTEIYSHLFALRSIFVCFHENRKSRSVHICVCDVVTRRSQEDWIDIAHNTRARVLDRVLHKERYSNYLHRQIVSVVRE